MIPRRRLLQIHRWSGLTAAALILLQALTGGLLVFRTGLAELADARRSASGAAPLSHVVQAAQARYPGFGLERIAFPQSAHGVYLVHLLNPAGEIRFVAVDPGTGETLRAGGIWDFPAEAALQIHYRLMSGRAGLALVMLTGGMLLTMASTGLSYWWPRKGRWAKSLTVDPRLPARIALRQAHRTAGVIFAASALFSASTGLLVAGEFFLTPGPLMPLRADARTPDGNIDAALAAAKADFPGHTIRDVRTPAPRTFDVFFWAPGVSPHAVDRVRIDLASGRVTGVMAADHAGALWMTVLPLHSGDSLGLPGSIVILLGAIGLCGLALTGPVVWAQARRRQ
jgi:uncharacterized iron-regulated membrane protein